MGYKVIANEVTVLRDLDEIKDAEQRTIGFDRESRTWLKDEIIPDEDVAQIVKEQYAAGDERTLSLLEHVSEKKAQTKKKKDEGE